MFLGPFQPSAHSNSQREAARLPLCSAETLGSHLSAPFRALINAANAEPRRHFRVFCVFRGFSLLPLSERGGAKRLSSFLPNGLAPRPRSSLAKSLPERGVQFTAETPVPWTGSP